MKKITVLALTAALILAIVFCGLWIHEKNDQSDLQLLCRYHATEALENFRRYEKTGKESDYWAGVAEFRAFLDTWLYIEKGSDGAYLSCNSVCGFMMLQPERVQGQTDKLIATLELLAADYKNPNGDLRMMELNNILKHE